MCWGAYLLKQNLQSKSATLAVVGLGYVGLAVACKFAEVGFSVLGLERQAEKVVLIAMALCP